MIYIYTWIYECPSLNLTPVGATRRLPALQHRCHGSSPHWIGRSNPGAIPAEMGAGDSSTEYHEISHVFHQILTMGYSQWDTMGRPHMSVKI